MERKIYETPLVICSEVKTEAGFAVSYDEAEGIEGIYVKDPTDI